MMKITPNRVDSLIFVLCSLPDLHFKLFDDNWTRFMLKHFAGIICTGSLVGSVVINYNLSPNFRQNYPVNLVTFNA